MPAWKMKGQYLKNCNCIATCPCDTVGIPYPNRGCEGLNGMHITEGHFGKVKLDGLNWAAAYCWPGALHEGNGSLQPYVDVRANVAQRDAILQILSGKHGGTFFEILAAIITTVHEPQFVPIEFEFSKRNRTGRIRIPGFGEAACAPLTVPASGAEQRVTVRMPDGFEYKEMEVAQTVVLKGTGPIKFNHQGTHSSLANVTHTHKGLVA